MTKSEQGSTFSSTMENARPRLSWNSMEIGGTVKSSLERAGALPGSTGGARQRDIRGPTVQGLDLLAGGGLLSESQ